LIDKTGPPDIVVDGLVTPDRVEKLFDIEIDIGHLVLTLDIEEKGSLCVVEVEIDVFRISPNG